MLFVGSRYISVGTKSYTVSSGITVGLMKMRPTTVVPDGETEAYTVKAGETFETLAYKLFGNARRWWILADMNPHIFWPLDLKAGDQILLPSRVQAQLS